MKIGIFDHVEKLPALSLSKQYSDRISFVQRADELGFYSYHVAEHHHSPLTVAPSQGTYLGALASVTNNIRLCPLVYVLPLHHPVRAIEEICMLDNLTEGRLDIGFGRGAPVGDELSMWGRNPEESNEIYEESLEIIFQGLTNEFLNFQGKHFEFEDLWMELRPYQQPYPPIWVAGSPVKAGELGSNLISEGTIEEFPKVVDKYREVWSGSRKPKTRFNFSEDPLLGVSKRIIVGASSQFAEKRAKESYEVHLTNYRKPLPEGRSRRPRIMIEREVGNRILPWTVDFETAINKERVLAGSEAQVIEYIYKYISDSGANFLLLSFQWGDLSHEEALETMEIVADEFIK